MKNTEIAQEIIEIAEFRTMNGMSDHLITDICCVEEELFDEIFDIRPCIGSACTEEEFFSIAQEIIGEEGVESLKIMDEEVFQRFCDYQ